MNVEVQRKALALLADQRRRLAELKKRHAIEEAELKLTFSKELVDLAGELPMTETQKEQRDQVLLRQTQAEMKLEQMR